MNKPIYLGLSILDLSKIVMYTFWYDYIKLKYQDNAKLYYMNTDSFINILRLMMFMKILLKMLKNGLIHQIMSVIDHCLKERTKKLFVI